MIKGFKGNSNAEQPDKVARKSKKRQTNRFGIKEDRLQPYSEDNAEKYWQQGKDRSADKDRA